MLRTQFSQPAGAAMVYTICFDLSWSVGMYSLASTLPENLLPRRIEGL
jgi:hypothetical protein